MSLLAAKPATRSARLAPMLWLMAGGFGLLAVGLLASPVPTSIG